MLLLDTCCLLWLVSDHSHFTEKAAQTIIQNQGALCVSAMSAFEIGVLVNRKRIKLQDSPEAWFDSALETHGLQVIPLSWAIAIRSTQLPLIHSDPVDRMLIATAMAHDFALLTPDKKIHSYPNVNAVW